MMRKNYSLPNPRRATDIITRCSFSSRISTVTRNFRNVRQFICITLATFFLMTAILFSSEFTQTVYASDGDEANQSIAITVVVPRPEDNQPEAPAQPTIEYIYPIQVWENAINGRREIIRLYELRDNESPNQIPREPFERDGFRFELAEIVRREMPVHNTREHVETVTVSTQTNDLATVIRLLSPTLEYLTDDGYFGILALDVSTIQIKSDGTRTTSHNVTRTREFPHLSSMDTSLIPKTITEGGRTYSLSNVEWRNQGTTAVDYRQVGTSFTAVATYSGTTSRTSTIGYTTTAEYRGQISRIATGRTEFTVQFIGIPIVTPIVNVNQSAADNSSVAYTAADGLDTETLSTEDAAAVTTTPEYTSEPSPAPESVPPVIDTVTVEHVQIGGIVIEREQIILPPEDADDGDIEEDYDMKEQNNETSGFPFGYVGIAVLFVAGLAIAYFAGKKGKAIIGMLKKTSCVVLALLLIGGISESVLANTHAIPNIPAHTAHNHGAQGTALPNSLVPNATTAASSLPSYGFGRGREERAVHFDNQAMNNSANGGTGSNPPRASPIGNSNNTGAIHMNPSFVSGSAPAIHINPSHSPSFSSPHLHVNSNINPYFYGERIGRLTVERLNRTINVIAGATMEAMDFGAGHFSFTGLNYGNTGLIGHNRGRTNGFFSFVRELREGDILILEAGGMTRRYAVAIVYVVDENDFGPLMQFGDHRLTLITCVEYVSSQRRVAVGFFVD